MKKITFYIFSILIVLLLIEILFRGFFWLKYEVPFFKPSKLIEIYYPELRLQDSVINDGATKNVLILGGSVIGSQFGPSDQQFEDKLEKTLNSKVNILNLATPGHASLDSYLKFSLFPKDYLDLVIIYHGINETRANNCPPEVFKNDYSHILRYREVKYVYNYYENMDIYTTAFGLVWIYRKIEEKLFGVQLLPTDDSMANWLKYGEDIKTKEPFRKNYQGIIDKCEYEKTPLLLMSFSYYLSPSYTEEKFAAKQLDYVDYLVPISRWGKKENVTKGIDTHNQVIQKFTNTNPASIFLDIKNIFPQEGKYFDDPCHFSPEGIDTFTTLISQFLINHKSIIEKME